MTDRKPSEYRPCVGVMLVNGEGQAFVGKRIDNKEGDRWQMPQGGVDPGEDLDIAMLRELNEETGITPRHLEIVDRMGQELYYDLPEELMGKLWGGKYRGQRQFWYLVRFTGTEADVNLEAHKHPEFCEWKWVDPELLPEIIVPFKREIYAAVVEAFRGKA
ncbi:RNA pyrophosphohydrolase [Altererythrobacter sp. B11]|uniref:RNA pyrophosphohydrolase n=1 Tax=Altererythrobacter sp. B11 TaxID=2060312 RepID=UPI000DC6E225|nr:RNA pyrophosphohydrolase [Altererythrobacter sp. B11]BBC72479.1 RNA pyrophosphohydrolase [Altererythrobacter sp. B11]